MAAPGMSNADDQPSGMARVVERNIQALLSRRRREERTRSFEVRIADAITRFTGSMRFVYVHLLIYGTWIVVNLPGFSWIKPFDPTYVMLAMVASVESIFLSTFILISQNRMSVAADQRANLDLQISLLAEYEVTRLIKLVTEVARQMGIEGAKDPELTELACDVAPERLLDVIEHQESQFDAGDPPEEETKA